MIEELPFRRRRKFDESMPERTKMRRQNQNAQGLKILSPPQKLSRLPISLPRLKAGNNSEKLKNEIRQLLYSLSRLKKPSKTIDKHFMKTII